MKHTVPTAPHKVEAWIDSHLTELREARRHRQHELVAAQRPKVTQFPRTTTHPTEHVNLPWHDFREEALQDAQHPMQTAPHKIEAWIDTYLGKLREAGGRINEIGPAPKGTNAWKAHEVQRVQRHSEREQIEKTLGELESIREGQATLTAMGTRSKTWHRLSVPAKQKRIRASLQDYLKAAEEQHGKDELKSFLNWHRAWQRHAEHVATGIARSPSPPPRINEVDEYLAHAKTNGGPNFLVHSSKRLNAPVVGGHPQQQQQQQQQQPPPPGGFSATTGSEFHLDDTYFTPGSPLQQTWINQPRLQHRPSTDINMEHLYDDVLPHLQQLSGRHSPLSSGAWEYHG